MLSLSRVLSTRLALFGYRRATTTMGKKQFYAVVKGKRPGLYSTWEECSSQVKNFPGNLYKGFAEQHEAVQYLANHGVLTAEQLPGLGPASEHAGLVQVGSSVAGRRALCSVHGCLAVPLASPVQLGRILSCYPRQEVCSHAPCSTKGRPAAVTRSQPEALQPALPIEPQQRS
jgi:hypothetical protein